MLKEHSAFRLVLCSQSREGCSLVRLTNAQDGGTMLLWNVTNYIHIEHPDHWGIWFCNMCTEWNDHKAIHTWIHGELDDLSSSVENAICFHSFVQELQAKMMWVFCMNCLYIPVDTQKTWSFSNTAVRTSISHRINVITIEEYVYNTLLMNLCSRLQ